MIDELGSVALASSEVGCHDMLVALWAGECVMQLVVRAWTLPSLYLWHSSYMRCSCLIMAINMIAFRIQVNVFL